MIVNYVQYLFLTDLEKLAIRMCALGAISGKLKEWPRLSSALSKLNLLNNQQYCWQVRGMCKMVEAGKDENQSSKIAIVDGDGTVGLYEFIENGDYKELDWPNNWDVNVSREFLELQGFKVEFA